MNCNSTNCYGFDYYPGGMLMVGRYSAGDYKYGFNGKERDDETKGVANQYDYGLRIYDPRIGKFLSVDPLERDYPFYSPYHFAGGNPIEFIDLDGAEPLKLNVSRYYASIKVTCGEAGIKGTFMGIPFSIDYSMENSMELEWKAYVELTPLGSIIPGVAFIRREIENKSGGTIGPLGGENSKIKETIDYYNTDEGYLRDKSESYQDDETGTYGIFSSGNKTDKLSTGTSVGAIIFGGGAEVGVEQNSNSNQNTNTSKTGSTSSTNSSKRTTTVPRSNPSQNKTSGTTNSSSTSSSYSVTLTDNKPVSPIR